MNTHQLLTTARTTSPRSWPRVLSLAGLAAAHGALLFGLCLGCGNAAVSEFERARSNGRERYLANCAPCHGELADGNGPRRDTLDPPPRDYTDPAWRATATEDSVFMAIWRGVDGTAMPAWDLLAEEDVHDLTTYVLSVAEHGARVEGVD